MGKRIPTGKSYRFTTIKEVAEQLTVDQIDDFLADFGTWLRFMKTGKSGDKEFDDLAKTMQETIKALAEVMGEDPKVSSIMLNDCFAWNDDGSRAPKAINIGTKDTDGSFKTTVRLTMPEKKA